MSEPVIAVISRLVCLGLNPKSEIRFFPYFVPIESPATASAALPNTSENINNQLVFSSKILQPRFVFMCMNGSSSAIRTDANIIAQPIDALSVMVSPRKIMLLNNPNTDSRLIMSAACDGFAYFCAHI
jgi:hypothetical protein